MARHHRLLATRAHLRELAGEPGGAPRITWAASRSATSLPERRYLAVQAARLEADPGKPDNAAPTTRGDRRAWSGAGRFVRKKIFKNLVADADRSAGQDVRPKTAAVDEIFDDPGAGELLQVTARLAELDAQALDVADAETLADQVVEPDVTHHDLPPGLGAGQADVLERFGLDQGQRLPGPAPSGKK